MKASLYALSFFCITSSPLRAGDSEDLAFFERRIRPLLVAKCYECHSEDKKVKGNLLLDRREGWQRGGDSGPAIQPGDPENSLLIRAVRYTDPDLQMPPKGKLDPADIERLTEWVARGATDPRDAATRDITSTMDLEAGRKFWSFQPVRRPAVPPGSTRALSPVDSLIEARLREAEIKPALETSPTTWLRRLTFDLIGLPPTPEERSEFLVDDSPDARQRVIDRLLASPAFGERWGKHWLDVVRYADSSGGGRSKIFRQAWRYRDYVLHSFNQDKPFDQMIREQIAGDLLPDSQSTPEALVGTGFLTLAPTNYENQDKEQLDLDVADEQVDTLGRAFMGMTIGCARCHDHFFDPIPTRDYYAMTGIFLSTRTLRHANVSELVYRDLPQSGETVTRYGNWQAEVKKLDREISGLKKQIQKLQKGETTKARFADLKDLPGIVLDDTEADKQGRWKPSSFVAGALGLGYVHDEGSGKGEKSLTWRPEIPTTGRYELRVSYTPSGNRCDAAPFTIRHADGKKTVRVDQRVVPPIDRRFISLGTYRFEKGKSGTIQLSNENTRAVVIGDAVQLIPVEEPIQTASTNIPEEKTTESDATEPQEQQELADREQALKQVESKRKELQKQAPPKPPQVMTVLESDKPDDTHILIRGVVRKTGEKVPRGFLQVTEPLAKFPSIPDEESGRLELAEWLCDPSHPLVTRVFVNRIWHHLFGEGIVPSVDVFGKMGERPSHPELLDWLADDFVRRQWSIKGQIRDLVASATYAQSTQAGRETMDKDPVNRLFGRQNIRRLDAEAIRDSMHAVADDLDLMVGGATIPAKVNSVYGYQYQGHRRSVYVPVFRNSLLDVLDAFDTANPNLVQGRRSHSTLPTQALYLMNSSTVHRLSTKVAGQMMKLEPTDRLDQLFLRMLNRLPGSEEEAVCRKFLAENKESPEAWSRLVHSLYGSIDFRYLR